ncbi:MAG: hypothetical protein FWG27_03020 [Treponema sp.]|nr:hypothetical protein [Treponema sp.]
MKKSILAFALILSLGTALNAQLRSTHYEIIVPAGNPDGAAYSGEMEQRFAAYNKVFCFNPALLSTPLRVRVFTNKAEYDSYVTSKLGNPRPGAVYIHYQEPANRELVIHRGSDEEKRLVPHQAFVQFLRAFISNPPVWIREGFAVYFNTLEYDRTRGTLVYEENLNWLETVKRLTISPESILQAGPSVPNIQAASWSLVSFFMAGKTNDYYRALTDSFILLSPSATAEENTQGVYKRLILFNSIAELNRDYQEYIAGKKTFIELIEEGQKAYGSKNFAAAGDLFRRAAELKNTHYASYYYLGLLAYEEKKYDDAEALYRKAFDYGAERALIQYARGVNAAAAGKKAEAIGFLEDASAADSVRYKARADELINKLR